MLLVWLYLGAIPNVGVANDRYRTDLLKTIANKLSIQQRLDTLSNGEYAKWTSFKSKPVTVIVDKQRVTHIGYSIFTAEQRKGLGWEICNFLERYSLELDIPTAEHLTVAERMGDDGVRVLKGDLGMLPKLCNDSTICMNFQMIDNQGYVLSWRQDSIWLCRVAFPIEYDLLYGTNMDERERRLAEELRSEDSLSVEAEANFDAKSMVKAWQDNYYTQKGETYLLDNLNANKYFEKNDSGEFVPIFNRLYPIESLANLFTGNLVENDYTLDIRLRKYGFKTDTISVPLSRWVGYCHETGCKAYFGIISIDKDKAECELVMHNSIMGYNHIMNIVFPATLFDERTGHIFARLNSYVTASRVKHLFEETKQTIKK